MKKLRPNCEVCSTFLAAVEDCQGDECKNWSLGTISAIFNDSNCEQHKAFINRYLGYGLNRYESLYITLYEGRLSLNYCYIGDDGGEWGGSLADLLVVDSLEKLPGVHQGRHLNRDYIDAKLIQKWMSYCDDNHGLDCKRRTPETAAPFDWLVDVEANCIVPAPKHASFLALSYVWGQTPTLQTTRENLSALRRPGSLAGTLSDAIPATIKHAIGLVRLLGQKYLWVDSLCIIQDDEESVRRHIEHLSSIFESAILTIAAADGEDANCGLSGLQGISEPRELPPVLVLADTLSVTMRVGDKITRSKWSTRGWTLQESLFSRRKLVFIRGTVRWICQSNTYYEEVDSPLDMESTRLRLDGAEHREKRSVQDLALSYPDLAKLMDLLSDYSFRTLSFEEDVILAISSTLRALEGAFPSGFIYGLPVTFLDVALIWRGCGKLRHRRASSGISNDCPPSWTWAGWKGRVDSLCWTSNTYLKEAPFSRGRAHHRDFQTMPILEWHTCTSKQSQPVPIPHHSEWYEYKRRFMGKSSELPPGWQYRLEDMEAMKAKAKERREIYKITPDIIRFDDTDCPITLEDLEDLQTPYFYLHDSVPDVKFWHPVPIRDGVSLNGGYTHPKYGRFLWAKTQQARLWAAKPRPSPSVPLAASYRLGEDMFVAPMFSTILGVTTVLRDEEDVDVGEMEIDTEEDFNRVMKHKKDGKETGFPCDLVAISRGFDFAQPMEPDKEVYTFYNVLWIVWLGGVAYRRGVGRIKRKSWEALERKDIELILG